MSREKLEAEIKNFIGHDDECSLDDGIENKCDCGTYRISKDILTAIDAYEEEKEKAIQREINYCKGMLSSDEFLHSGYVSGLKFALANIHPSATKEE